MKTYKITIPCRVDLVFDGSEEFKPMHLRDREIEIEIGAYDETDARERIAKAIESAASGGFVRR